jgi:glucokinase
LADYVLALDLGGSLAKIARIDARDALSAIDRVSTPTSTDSDSLVLWLAEQIASRVHAPAHGRCLGWGVVVPGIIRADTGHVVAAPNLGWYDVPLQTRLTELTGLDGVVAHDVRSGGLAEATLGAGRGVANLLFLPLGTGIAGAMFVDGRLLDADGYAGEIGHIRVRVARSLPCACGQMGCLETVASAAGVARSYQRLTEFPRGADGLVEPHTFASEEAPASARLGATTGVDAQQVATRARAGDAEARAAFALAADALAEALLLYLTLLGPEVVVIGGGLSAAADLFVPQVEQSIAATVSFQRRPRLVTAVLGPDAGVIGAGLQGWDHVRRQSRDEGSGA